MPVTPVAIFGPANFAEGVLPFEDRTYLSSLSKGDTLTWIGGGERVIVSITDNADDSFDEAQTNQTLTDPVTFGGVSYAAGQVVTPTYTIIFSGSDGNSYTMSSFNFSPNTEGEIADAVFWEGSVPPPNTVLTVTTEINPTAGNARPYPNMVVCFAAGTQIATAEGEAAIETLQKGSVVKTFAGENRTIRWIGARHFTQAELDRNPNLRPIVISQGALGEGLPRRDLVVSRQHRILVSSKIAQRMFDAPSVLVAAHMLTALPGVYVAQKMTSVSYYHILLDGHAVLSAEGAPAESLFLGEQACHALPPDRLEEIRLIMPQFFVQDGQMAPVVPLAEGRRQKQLIRRHVANNMPLYDAQSDARATQALLHS